MQRHLAIHIDWLVSCFSNSSSIPRPRYMSIYIFFFFFKFASLFPQRITILMVSIVAMLQRSLKNIASFIYDFPRMTKPTVAFSLSLSLCLVLCSSIFFRFIRRRRSRTKSHGFRIKTENQKGVRSSQQSGDPCTCARGKLLFNGSDFCVIGVCANWKNVCAIRLFRPIRTVDTVQMVDAFRLQN